MNDLMPCAMPDIYFSNCGCSYCVYIDGKRYCNSPCCGLLMKRLAQTEAGRDQWRKQALEEDALANKKG